MSIAMNFSLTFKTRHIRAFHAPLKNPKQIMFRAKGTSIMISGSALRIKQNNALVLNDGDSWSDEELAKKFYAKPLSSSGSLEMIVIA